MSKKITLLLLLISFVVDAQTKTYNGIIKDIATQLPIELVSISIQNSNIGTVSNEEGNFRITIPNDLKTLQFNHLNYNLYFFTPEAGQTELEIFLEPKAFTLDEVIVSNVPLDKLLSDLKKNSKKHFDKSALIKTYYREMNNVNGKYITFSDGMLDFYVKKSNGKSDLHVKQSRAFKLDDPEMNAKQKNSEGVSFDVKKGISGAYSFNIVDELSNNDDYDYQLRNKTDKNGNSIQVIKIEPKENIQKDLYEGTITYDGKTKLILEIDVRKAPSHAQYSKLINILIAKVKINDVVKKTSFRIDGDKYILVYSRVMLNFYIKMGKQINDNFKCLSDVYALDYQEGQFELAKDKRYPEKSLYKAGNNFTTEFWKTNNIMLLSDTEEKIIKSLE